MFQRKGLTCAKVHRMNIARLLYKTMPAVLAALTVCLFLSTAVRAKEMKPISFAQGASSASIKGDIQGMDRDTYPITAKAGQTMSVAVKNKLKLVLFRIQMPGTKEKYLPKAGEEDDATEWHGVLPVSGTYTIVVGAMRGNDTKYTLDVQITK